MKPAELLRAARSTPLANLLVGTGALVGLVCLMVVAGAGPGVVMAESSCVLPYGGQRSVVLTPGAVATPLSLRASNEGIIAGLDGKQVATKCPPTSRRRPTAGGTSTGRSARPE